MSELTADEFADDYEQLLRFTAKNGWLTVEQAMDVYRRHVLAATNPGDLA